MISAAHTMRVAVVGTTVLGVLCVAGELMLHSIQSFLATGSCKDVILL